MFHIVILNQWSWVSWPVTWHSNMPSFCSSVMMHKQSIIIPYKSCTKNKMFENWITFLCQQPSAHRQVIQSYVHLIKQTRQRVRVTQDYLHTHHHTNLKGRTELFTSHHTNYTKGWSHKDYVHLIAQSKQRVAQNYVHLIKRTKQRVGVIRTM